MGQLSNESLENETKNDRKRQIRKVCFCDLCMCVCVLSSVLGTEATCPTDAVHQGEGMLGGRLRTARRSPFVQCIHPHSIPLSALAITDEDGVRSWTVYMSQLPWRGHGARSPERE